jgi:hypothetical protein
MLKCKHSGDLGDIIFSLPTVRAFGYVTLCLDETGGLNDPLIDLGYKKQTNLNKAGIEFIKPLIEYQKYIEEVIISEECDYNLNEFRKYIKYNNLAKSHLAAFGLDLNLCNTKWLEVPEYKYADQFKGKVIISRTPKVQGNHEFWEFKVRQGKDKCVFIGLPKEHEIFEYALGYKVDFYQVKNALEMAQVINSGYMFIGNQSLAHSIAEGLKKQLVCEVNKNYPAAVFNDGHSQYV